MPPVARITKEFKFEAAHRLPNHKGKCSQPHGHSYRVVVACEGAIRDADGSSEEGMVLDFSQLSLAWKRIEPALDHRDLNLSIGIELQGPTTAENIATWILKQFVELVGLIVTDVTVYETATSSVTVRR